MKFTFLDNAAHIRSRFLGRFVLTWEEFQVHYADWIAKLAGKGYAFGLDWYEQSYMWDKMSPDFPLVSFREALAFLRTQEEPVIFLSEAPDHHSKPRLSYEAEHHTDFAVACNAPELADLIEQEWFEDYRLAQQDLYNPDPVLPSEVYVFDRNMTWCVVFTHETTDWDSELDNPMKAAESRYCIFVPPAELN